MSIPTPLASQLPQPSQTTLYGPTDVGIATFLGSPVAGSIIMAMNYKRLGKSSAAVGVIVFGVILTVTMIVIGGLIPARGASLGLCIGALAGMIALTKQLQGPALEAHRAAGGRVGSSAMPWVIGLIFLLVIFGAIFAWVMFTPVIEGTRVVVGTQDEIFYSGTTTETETKSLGKQLQDVGFFQDRGVSVKFTRDASGTVLGFVVNDGVWEDPDMLKSFEEVVRQLAPAIGGLPIKIQMMDAAGEVKKEWVIQ